MRCKFRKKNGKRCEANAQSTNGVCVFHDPAQAEQGRKARQRGGLARSRPAKVLSAETPDAPLTNSMQVSGLLAESINAVRKGHLDSRVANAVGYLCQVLLRALEQGPMEERMMRIEKALVLGLTPGSAPAAG